MCTKDSAILVQQERHLLEVMRYIVLNPVRAGMVVTADAWAWSSYRATVGLVSSPSWLQTDAILAAFGDGEDGRRQFVEFVHVGVEAPSCWRHLRHQIYLGDSAFISTAQARITIDAPGLREYPLSNAVRTLFQMHDGMRSL
jgi:hypothetical protein